MLKSCYHIPVCHHWSRRCSYHPNLGGYHGNINISPKKLPLTYNIMWMCFEEFTWNMKTLHYKRIILNLKVQSEKKSITMATFKSIITLFVCPPKFCVIKHCFHFFNGLKMVPRVNKNNAYAKFWRINKEYYGIFKNGLFNITRYHEILN